MWNEIIMSRQRVVLMLTILFFTLSAQGKYGGGSGTSNDPYLIYDAHQMNAIGADGNVWDKHFKLMADIDLAGFTGTSFNIIGKFAGVFDGNGHTISNFNYASTGTACIGLFAYVYGENAEIKDLGLIAPEVDAGTGDIVEVGSLVGLIDQATISNCYVKGGRVGCSAIVWSSAGGLVGSNRGAIVNCYAAAEVSGTMNIGGLVGDNSGTITECYSTGSITGGYKVGGLVGNNYGYGDISASFWDIETSGRTTSAGGTGKTTAEMQTACTFLAWMSCKSPVWTIDEGQDYPRLWWENVLGEPLSPFSGGSGTPADPYLIYKAKHLNAMGLLPCYLGKHFKLMSDIDLSSYTGTSFNIIGNYENPFTGIFDGNGHTISNFTYTSTGTNYIGLFGYIDDPNVEIKNLGLIEPYVDAGTGHDVGSLVGWLREGTITACYAEGGGVSGNDNVGGLVGEHGWYEWWNPYPWWGYTISNCYSTASVIANDNVGGLVGDNHGTITNSYSAGSVSGDYYVGGLVGLSTDKIIDCCSIASVSGGSSVGGLVGQNGEYDCGWWYCSYYPGTIINSYASGDVAGSSSVGGLVGNNDYGTITNCYSESEVSGETQAGGLVGRNQDTITNCYSMGSVSGDYSVSGLVGYNDSGTISNCYSTVAVLRTGESIGGLVGSDNYGMVSASFWDTETSGQVSSDGGIGLATVEMQNANTFIDSGWGCVFVWTIDDGKDYPHLWWEDIPGELITGTPSHGGGSGDPNDPYLIYTAEQLNTIGLIPCHLSKHFKLMADFDLSGYTGTSFNIIGYMVDQYSLDNKPFTGVFDGNGHTISNFTYTSTATNFIGIFGYVDGGNIKNLGFIDPNVDAGIGRHVGSLVGYLYNGTITNCYVEGGTVSGHYYVGGLVGYSDGDIRDCYATGSVFGDQFVGGLVGYNENSIVDCYTSGNVTGGNNSSCVGGLCGKSTGPWHGTSQSSIQNCYNTATVTGNVLTGGLIGHSGAVVTGCYSSGSVNGGGGSLGGLIGRNGGHGIISNCYSTGSVMGDEDVGGLVGYNKGTVSNSFWDIETSGQDWSDGGTGLPTNEMQIMSTFTDASWDFVGEILNGIDDIWFIPQQDYPHLWWEGIQVPMKLTPSTLNCRSEGNWVKAHITLPEGFTVADVNSERPAVLHSFGIESIPLYVFVNKDKVVEIEAAFEREAVCSLTGNWPEVLTVAGFLTDGNIFLGTSTVRIIHPSMKVIEDLANYWLNADCVQPDFCDGIDMNRDSLVNLLDYALLMNINVEFVSE